MADIVLTADETRVAKAMLEGDISDPVQLLSDAGCDVSTFFEWGDWAGVDFRHSNLEGVSFRGAVMCGALVAIDQAHHVLNSQPRSSPEFCTPVQLNDENAIHHRNLEENVEGASASSGTWKEVRQELLKVVGKNNFSAWIEPITFDRVEERTVHFHVPTEFIGSWVESNFGDLILHHLSSHGVRADRVQFSVATVGTVPASTPVQHATPQPSALLTAMPMAAPYSTAPATAGTGEHSGAKLNPNFTFANFVVGKPNELAHAAARRAAETLDVTFNPLFLYGGVGLGKTHLMHAIAWDLQARFPDAKILYLSAEQFMHRFVRALREQDAFNFNEIFRSVDILMVDDVQFISGRTSIQQEFFHTFNALVDVGKQIVISGDRAPVDMEELDNRIASRLQCGWVVDIHPTDYELRLRVLHHKAEILGAKYPQTTFADGVLEYLAQRISSNVRVLEGALIRLFVLADLIHCEVTVETAKEHLKDVLRATDKKVSMDEIIKRTCEYYKIRQVDILCSDRRPELAQPRQMAMYLCKRMTTRSLPEIGKKFGGRDQTTILYGIRKTEELMQTDSQIAEDAVILRHMLGQ